MEKHRFLVESNDFVQKHVLHYFVSLLASSAIYTVTKDGSEQSNPNLNPDPIGPIFKEGVFTTGIFVGLSSPNRNAFVSTADSDYLFHLQVAEILNKILLSYRSST